MSRSSRSSDNASIGPSTDDMVRQLRARAEEAIAASIHHASLSQQYLALGQKYAALSEQAVDGGSGSLRSVVSALDRESQEGIPAPPLGVPQVGLDRSSLSASTHVAGKAAPDRPGMPAPPVDSGADEAADLRTAGITAAPDDPSDVRPDPQVLADPAPAANPVTGTEQDAEQHPPTATETPDPPESAADSPKAPAPVDPERSSSRSGRSQPGRRSRRRAKRRRVRVRDLVRTLHSRMPVRSQRVRIKARRADLKPKLRTAVDELRTSRRPAAISAVVCAVLVLLLASFRLTFAIDPPLEPIVASFSAETEPVEETLPIEPPEEEPGEQTEAETEEPEDEPDEPEPDDEETAPAESQEEPAEMPTDEEPQTDQPSTQPAGESVAGADEGVDGRSAAGRQQMLQKYGGSAASESAVHRGLQWLASVQRRDGSWDFSDIGPSSDAGTVVNPIGGTAYALLPFLAAGQTHQSGEYRDRVRAGLDYLMKTGISVPAGLDLRGVLNKGNPDDEPNEAYYVHGAATLALCEALWMTGDRRLRPSAEAAVRFLLNSQDPRGGGWRYLPQQPGSTSVTAMQVMALKSAEHAGISVPTRTWQGITHYLDSVQVDGRGRYGYEIQKKSYQASITAMALLSRLYLGWTRDDGDLREGIRLLDRKGPYDNLYYNYFATQVMRHWGGDEWTRWNTRLRDDLVRWQESDGPEAGSWTPRNRADYSVAGGRLLTTCLATLTLEVYYRYEPLLPEDNQASPAVASATD